MTDIDKLVPASETVQIGGREFAIKPLTVRRMAAFSKLFDQVSAQERKRRRSEMLDEGISHEEIRQRLDQFEFDLMSLAANHAEKLAQAVAVATDLKVEDVMELPGDTFIELAGAVVGAYSDFFVRRAVPALASAATKVAATIGSLQASVS